MHQHTQIFIQHCSSNKLGKNSISLWLLLLITRRNENHKTMNSKFNSVLIPSSFVFLKIIYATRFEWPLRTKPFTLIRGYSSFQLC